MHIQIVLELPVYNPNLNVRGWIQAPWLRGIENMNRIKEDALEF